MQLISLFSTDKCGMGKTTLTAKLGVNIAHVGLRVLLLNGDMRPTLFSVLELPHCAPSSIYELLTFIERDLPDLIFLTTIRRLDIIRFNAELRQLNTPLQIFSTHIECRQPTGERSLSTMKVIQRQTSELPPQWRKQFSSATGKAVGRLAHV